MTEAEWLDGADPDDMRLLMQLSTRDGRYLGSPRKLRLFAAACARQLWPLLGDPRSRDAVAVAESFADREAGAEALAAAYAGACAAETACRGGARHAAMWAAFACRPHDAWPVEMSVPGVPAAIRAALLRCLFGNPWRPAAGCACCEARGYIPPYGECCAACGGTGRDPALGGWLRWADRAVPRIAASIYAGRRWEEAPILADALEEAGCCDARLLAHLRGRGPHARGCHALDLLRERRRDGARLGVAQHGPPRPGRAGGGLLGGYEEQDGGKGKRSTTTKHEEGRRCDRGSHDARCCWATWPHCWGAWSPCCSARG